MMRVTSYGIEFQTKEEAKENERSLSVALLCAGLLRKQMKMKIVIFKCYSSEKLITLNILHEAVPTWYSFRS